MKPELHQIYGFDLTAKQALSLLLRIGQARPQDAKAMLEVLERGSRVPPQMSWLAERMYLVQLSPASRKRH